MFWKKTISHKKIWEIQNYSSYSDIIKPNRHNNNLTKVFVVIVCIAVVWFFGKYIMIWAQMVWSSIGQWTMSVVSNALWKDMEKDEFGNINIMVVGYGGEGHMWWYLADSIILASRNPKLGSVSMLSFPRDLYVFNKQEQYRGRINEVFSHWVWRKLNFATWAKYLADQIEDISWLEVPYYVLVDFQWFEQLIDTLWWLNIDVPTTIHDTRYPNETLGYLTFHVNAGLNHFDGRTALMYARSRHSSSDFSRSLRQQQIFKAVLNKLSSTSNLFNPSKIKELYNNYTQIVKTNISIDEILWATKDAYNIEHLFSFGYTTECSHKTWRLSTAACFLYNPNRSLFGGAAVMIPIWASPSSLDFYEYTRKFAFYITHNQEYLIEKAKIVIQNWIDKNYAKQIKKKTDWYANQIAVKLRKFAFSVIDVENAKENLTGTTVYILWTWSYDKTIDTLKYFMPIDNVVKYEDIGSWQIITTNTWADLVVVLWNSYLDSFVSSEFSYYK